MNSEVFKNTFLYICDNDGQIKMVVNALELDESLTKEEKIFEKVLPGSESVWKSLMSNSVDEERLNYWKGFLTSINGESYVCFLTVLDNNQVMVLGMKEDMQHYLYEEILKINGQLTNKIRKLYKEKSVSESGAYDEISQMNNELANSRRELKKKNYELEELNLRLEQLSIKDPLTDLFNRRYFYTITPDVIHRSKRLKYSCCIIMIDINGFKSVNDNLGHDIGDLVLIHLSNCLKRAFRSGQDTAFRFGGDEFLILLEASNYNDSLLALERLNMHYKQDAKGTSLAAGIVEINYDEIQEDFTEFLKNADDLMYLEKKKMKKL